MDDRVTLAERLSEADVEAAGRALSEDSAVDVERLRSDLSRLSTVRERATALDERATAADVPFDALRELT